MGMRYAWCGKPARNCWQGRGRWRNCRSRDTWLNACSTSRWELSAVVGNPACSGCSLRSILSAMGWQTAAPSNALHAMPLHMPCSNIAEFKALCKVKAPGRSSHRHYCCCWAIVQEYCDVSTEADAVFGRCCLKPKHGAACCTGRMVGTSGHWHGGATKR